MNLNEYDISHPYQATLVATERITPPESGVEVRHLRLRVDHDDFDYVAGQSIGVLAPGPHPFGNPHHLRLYSIAGSPRGDNGAGDTISICVRRCFYIDEVSGESYPGIASNYLCDAREGALIQITGPYGSHFSLPADDACNLLMVGAGTGVAAFRAFVQHIYQERGGWSGKVRLFYGAKTGMELLYRNQHNQDLSHYYTEENFLAFEAVSPRPHVDESPALDRLIMDNAEEVWQLVNDPKTYVYIAGLHDAERKFQKAMVHLAGSEDAWLKTRAELLAQGRFAELLY